MRWLAWLLLALLAAPAAAANPGTDGGLAGGRAPDRVLTGQISRADYQTYKSVPFAFPKGADRLLIAIDLDRQEERTVIDIGLEDPNGIRGASGSNKRVILVGETASTPSYLPGAMVPGAWKLLIAVPNIRDGVVATWTARLWFLKPGEPDTPPPTAGRGPGWYRGDLHLHSGQSDGACAPQSGGAKVPCPLFLTLQTAAAHGLDFVSLTEHNSVAHHGPLREAQPYFDRMLLIPGREITTFFGHFNIHGVTRPIDFRIQPGGPVTFDMIADTVHRLGGIVVVNHPRLPSDERCMGCGWTMPAVDPAKVDAIETVNGASVGAVGGAVSGPVDGTPFWRNWVAANGATTALGASDNHDGAARTDTLGVVGRPVTVVFADDLTQPAVLGGIKRGRVFIDTENVPGRHLDFTLRIGGVRTHMGGVAMRGARPVVLDADVAAPAGTILRVIDGDTIVAEHRLSGVRQAIATPLKLAKGRHLLRLAVLRDGQAILMSNAIVVE
ncbi:CehA/McbA family metallohydrolase [Polymorphobacter fuscus]|uniref:PHP domain-containing protein n=1 Tax=Sandarakinorhabdus fusca TaxID=1439888 RepID=A0A7C9GNE6_9SPHN|nr:CehA/McbA family metallohydrolase [Polymorphobacter fuscus]KAB7647443.1 PHP domain-containing protein [Polymorphobacter fuscus]MQT16695.1 PHP domain-containing protein [Polymorphobacter fuscus]NJC09319.1 hypothetical protein [Polymorphobacter fuscus]